ncbi:hypothetical protein [Mesorhizobium erdmanii]|uniref:Uncharacterized protein n=1 Tax=Mesorhizobium erdmanii TaxID=1777866 RepID=A0A6M7UPM7_9HYPH|nr:MULTISPECIES: hypothetical protein [Mesorhizobium]OBQ58575.1 hypothetical protein A8146_21820 [Mesorhizobium loti]QKC77950.1 hypothetical protein EB233_22645 [Mesorhizobium erdmanii]
MTSGAFYPLAGVWPIAMLAVFILAIRLSYGIEARSPDLVGDPREVMMFHTITNTNVARDEETQAMRRHMNWLLLVAYGSVRGTTI